MQLKPVTQTVPLAFQTTTCLQGTTEKLLASLGNLDVPIRDSCLELSTHVKGLTKEAEAVALENLNSKVFVVKILVGGGFDTYAYDETESQTQKGERIVPKDRDYFIAGTGSLGRSDDFTVGSDVDFVVFPANEDSVPFAQALQKEVTAVVSELTGANGLPFKADELMTGIYNYHVPPERAGSELLKPDFEDYDAEFDRVWIRPSIVPDTLRDLEFISGNEEAYKRLIESITPTLYPYETDDVQAKTVGQELARRLHAHTSELTTRVLDINSAAPCLKDDVLRAFHFYTWYTRAKEGIRTPSVFETLRARSQNGSIPCEHAGQLSDNYDFFLRAKTALSVVRGKVTPFRREERLLLTQDVLPQVAENLAMSAGDFRDAFSANLFASKAIISGNIN